MIHTQNRTPCYHYLFCHKAIQINMKRFRNLLILYSSVKMGLLFTDSAVNNLPVVQETWVPGFNPWVGKILCRRKWQPTSLFLLGKFHGQRSLAGYSPWDCKELDTT